MGGRAAADIEATSTRALIYCRLVCMTRLSFDDPFRFCVVQFWEK